MATGLLTPDCTLFSWHCFLFLLWACLKKHVTRTISIFKYIKHIFIHEVHKSKVCSYIFLPQIISTQQMKSEKLFWKTKDESITSLIVMHNYSQVYFFLIFFPLVINWLKYLGHMSRTVSMPSKKHQQKQSLCCQQVFFLPSAITSNIHCYCMSLKRWQKCSADTIKHGLDNDPVYLTYNIINRTLKKCT